MASLVTGLMKDAGGWFGFAAGHEVFLLNPGDAVGGLHVGDLEELQVRSGAPVSVKVLAVDTISQPNRARVERADTSEVLVVPVLEELPSWFRTQDDDPTVVDTAKTTIYQDYEDAFTLAQERQDDEAPQAMSISGPGEEAHQEAEGQLGLAGKVLQGLREEYHATVSDFQEHGAVGMLHGAVDDVCQTAEDAVQLVADVVDYIGGVEGETPAKKCN